MIHWFTCGDDVHLREIVIGILQGSLALRMPHEVKWEAWLLIYFTKQ